MRKSTQIKEQRGVQYGTLYWMASVTQYDYYYLYQNTHILKKYFGLTRINDRMYVLVDAVHSFIEQTHGYMPYREIKLPRNLKERQKALETSGYTNIMGFEFVKSTDRRKKRFAKRGV